jgi:hypothetical protein
MCILLLALTIAVAVLFARERASLVASPLSASCACPNSDNAELLRRVAVLEASLHAQGVALLEQASRLESDVHSALQSQTLAAARSAVEAWLDTAEERRLQTEESSPAAPPLDALLRAFDTWQADRTGLPDFALASGGGRVLAHSPLHHSQAGQLRSRLHPRADDLLLSAAMESPGHCLALDGQTGWVEVELRTRLQLSALTLEHVHPALAFDIGTAPAGFALLAAEEGRTETLAEGAFALSGAPVQTFPALGGGQPVRRVRLVLRGNQGANYTCLYRLRVHGRPAEG